ncbi:MAG: hypothetical protein PUP92_39340 [Rhizonema sp. PD38]|nr:hypothetical protein [Rhizonema sp. PD38]
MTVNNIPVNVAKEFSLSGEGKTIHYSTVNGPVLTYGKPPTLVREFSGKDIVQQDTKIGTLITVVLDSEVFSAVTTENLLSVLLPKVVGEKNPVQIKTEAILTTSISGGGIGFPESGQLETYEFLPLTGTASVQGS